MSLEKMAKILNVDEVELMHGHRGVAVGVRVGSSWRTSTIDHDVLERDRLGTIVKHLIHLADGHVNAMRSVLSKARAPQMADSVDLGPPRPYWPYETAPYEPPASVPGPDPGTVIAETREPDVVLESMPSRFHAIMEEMRRL